ncbi:MAG: M48 family metalloprotease [Acidobacteriota bacterium]
MHPRRTPKRPNHPWTRALFAAAGAALLAGSLTGCSTNPATGKSQLSFYSEAQEVQLGQQADQDLVQQYGVYDDPELARYVDELGQGLAAASERPNLPWTFRVLDDPVVNAFALPGGYVYVTRGILSHMSSEAELAAVLGHEIGHVTARHGVNRMSKAQLANIGLGIGSVLDPELARSVGNLAQSSLQLLFLQYSRDDERQADDLGFRYANRLGYPPGAFVEVFEMLQATGPKGGGRLPNYLLTHPDPLERKQTAQARVRSSSPDAINRSWRRDPFFDRIDGMTYGPDPEDGYFRDGTFVHPGLRLRLDLPSGWTAHNQTQALVVMSPTEDAIVQLTLAGGRSASDAARQFFNQQGLTVGNSWRDNDGIPLQEGRLFSAGELRGAAAFAEYDNRIYRLMAISKTNAWRRYEDDMEASLRSFDELRDRRLIDVEPMRISLVRLDRDLSLEEFQRRYPSDIDLETLAVINHVQPGDILPAGTRAKRVRGFDPGPQTNVKIE